jgi:epoxyqueuosine reductase QueG
MTHVFTDMPLDIAVPVTESRCGLCDRCVRCCLAKAARGVAWRAGVSREQSVDASACLRVAERLLCERAGLRDALCGVCIAVCPWARAGP